MCMSLASRVSPGKERGRIQLAGCEQKARGDYASMGTGLRRPTRNLCILMPAGYDAPRSYDAVFAFNDFPGKKGLLVPFPIPPATDKKKIINQITRR